MQRRTVLRTVGAFTAGLFADQIAERFILDPALETAEALAGDGPSDPFVATDFRTLFDQHAAPRQRAAFAAWEQGADVVAAVPELDPDGMHAVIEFAGRRARYVTFGHGLSVADPAQVVGRAVGDTPTRAYGDFVYNRAAACYAAGRWSFDSCYGWLAGQSTATRYLSLMLPCGDHVVSVGFPEHEWPAPARPASAPQGAASSRLRSGATS